MSTHPSNERGDVQVLWLVAVVLVAGVLAAVPFVLMGRQRAEQTRTGLGAVGDAQDVSAQANLESAIQTAEAYFSENGTFVGFGPGSSSLDPSLTYNLSPVAVRGQISIRGIGPTTVVLATKSDSGAVLCAASNLGSVTYGRVDAATAAQCTGGW